MTFLIDKLTYTNSEEDVEHMIKEIKKIVPTGVKKVIKKQLNQKDEKFEGNKVNNPNLLLDEVTINTEDVILTIQEDQHFRVTRIGFLVSSENKIHNLSFEQIGNQLVLKKSELHKIAIIGKHVFRVFYENDKKAHTMQLTEENLKAKYPISSATVDNSAFLYFYSNSNKNLTIEVVSKSKRKTAPKHIQGYLDGQFEPITLKSALFEPNHGKTNSGNMFALATELASREEFKVYWATKDVESAKRMFDLYEISNIQVVQHLSYDYGNIVATAELLFSDNTFYPFFSKRKGQRYINTWHGTPLKTLGKDIKGEETSYGNIVRNLLQADSLYFSNEYTVDHHLKSLDLDGVLKTKAYIAPSPRNSAFFMPDRSKSIRESENLQDKKIIAYLPTYRGKSSGASSETAEKIQELLGNLISNLPENYIIYYKLHPIDNQKISISDTEERIRKIPEDYELYDFLSATDGLITDYSSVMFDYALSNKPIYLYTYDQEEYFSERGTYLKLDELPFPKFDNTESLIEEIVNSENKNNQQSEFKNKFAPFDNENGAKEIIDHVLFDKQSNHIKEHRAYNGKPNVYIMGGPLWANGITSALQNLIDNIDLEKRNYILLVDTNGLKKENMGRYYFLDERIKIYPLKGFAIRSNFEDFLVKKFEAGKKLSVSEQALLKNAFEREMRRMFGLQSSDYFIHFSGYEVKFAEFIIYMEKVNTAIYVHNDMFKEYANKQNYNRYVIPEAYNHADKIVLVNDKLKESFVDHFPNLKNRIVVANNFIGYKNIKNTQNESFDEILLDTNFQYSLASQGQGNPLLALKSRLTDGVKNSEIRFQRLNEVYELINQSISGIVKNKYLHVTQNKAIKEILVKSYFVEEWNHFHKEFGENDEINSLLIDLLFPKLVEIYQKNILPHVYQNQNSLYDILLNKKPEKIDENLDVFRNVYNSYGLRKLEIIEELNDPDIKIFINIARFDNQKRLDRLIFAFEKVFQSNPETRLYIVASYGTQKDNILKIVKNSSASHAIRIFGAMDNPYPLLKQCDCFVFTSDYEALGLVVYEALAVGIPVVTTNLASTMRNLTEEQVYPVELSVEGVYDGMKKYLSGDFPNKPFDFESYESKSRSEFEKIFIENSDLF